MSQLASGRRTLVRCAHVLTMDDGLGDIPFGEILIEDDRIIEVGVGFNAAGAETIDASDLVALPGFVDGHRHTWQSAIRHCAVGWDLGQYQAHVQGVVGEALDLEDAYVGNLLGAITALDGGITTLRDESHAQNSPEHTDALIAGLRDSGIRGCFAYGWPSTDAMSWLWNSTRPLPEDIRRVRSEVLTDDKALVTLQAHLRGPELSDPPIATADVRRARELGLRMSMHMGTGEYGTLYHGIAALDKETLIGPDMTFVHCCTSSDEELDLVAEHGASVCVTAAVEASMPGLGVPATGRLLERGIQPCLGIDVEVGTPGDMFNVMRATLASERLRQTMTDAAGSTPAISAHDLLRFATLEGARALGLGDRTGSLRPGKQADIILVRLDDLNLVPGTDPAASLLAAGHAGNVDTVMVAGQVRKLGGTLTRPDVEAVVARGRASAQRLLERVTAATVGAH